VLSNGNPTLPRPLPTREGRRSSSNGFSLQERKIRSGKRKNLPVGRFLWSNACQVSKLPRIPPNRQRLLNKEHNQYEDNNGDGKQGQGLHDYNAFVLMPLLLSLTPLIPQTGRFVKFGRGRASTASSHQPGFLKMVLMFLSPHETEWQAAVWDYAERHRRQ